MLSINKKIWYKIIINFKKRKKIDVKYYNKIFYKERCQLKSKYNNVCVNIYNNYIIGKYIRMLHVS